ncbi:MAG: cysteine synthase A [Bacteroidetes bacterium HGW-Bacteroidetes-15]|nr:MAG: cysteine synthase A [Bacteroidetes bacterium HGW-Bacteroidetes-15]
MKANTTLELIGNTPHLRLKKLFPDHEVWIKLERSNPGGSIKDRIALAMINDAEEKGLLKPDGIIVEPTSGNTGIGLALVAAVKGYRIILVMPESMSVERRSLLKAYGAELVLTPREKGMKGAIEEAKRIVSENQNAFMPMQFENEANPRIHYKVTSEEILKDFPKGFDFMITGIGTGGHISGVGKRLKEVNPNTQVFGVEPEGSPVLSGGEPGPHPIQGIGAGFAPKTLNMKIVDKIIRVTGPESFEMARALATQEGVLAGISTGASIAAINKTIGSIEKGKSILTFGYDTGERYLSVEGLF